MDPVTLVVTALALEAAAGLKSTAEQVVKDAYSGLKHLIIERYQTAKTGVDLIESNPESETFKDTARELLQTTEAGQDEELLRQARTVVQTVEQLAPETAAAINIKAEDINTAANFRISDVVASGSNATIEVDVKRVEAGEDFEIKGLRATGGDSPESKKIDAAVETETSRVSAAGTKIIASHIEAGRDVTIIGGDQVGRDKTTVGNITSGAVAIGPGAQASVNYINPEETPGIWVGVPPKPPHFVGFRCASAPF